MFIQVTESMLREQFKTHGRGDQFSHEALGLLFNYFDCDAGTEQETELDVVAICCEFSEQSEQDIRDQYSIDSAQSVDDFLSERTIIIGKTSAGQFVYQQF